LEKSGEQDSEQKEIIDIEVKNIFSFKKYKDPGFQIIDSTRTVKDLGLKNSERDVY